MNTPNKNINKVRQGIIMYEDYIDFDGHDHSDLIESAFNDIITENNYNEVESSDISLKSFKPQDKLNPKFWVNNLLNSKIRLRLLDIADDFVDELEIGWVKPVDIILTGSLTNYNWSIYSDIDLHIIYNFKEIDSKINLVKDYFDSKKKIWNDKHDNLKIYGFPVEIYVQDVNEKHSSSGIFSIEKNKWIVTPNKYNISPIKLDKFFIKEKSARLMTTIDNLCEKYDNLCEKFKLYDIDYEINKLNTNVKFIFNKIKTLRKTNLLKNGEMSNGNIIYKILRRSGYIDILIDLKSKTYDLCKSIR